MKDKHITIIWAVGTVISSIWITSIIRKDEDYVECLAFSALFSQFLLFAYFAISLTINGILREYASYRFTLPVKEKFKNKKSPIYELQYSYLNGTYGISKWELNWCDSNYYFIPFSAIFQTYKYVEVDNYGSFLESELSNLKSLKKVYEDMYKADKLSNSIELSAKDKLNHKVEKLNMEFTNNYIK